MREAKACTPAALLAKPGTNPTKLCLRTLPRQRAAALKVSPKAFNPNKWELLTSSHFPARFFTFKFPF